MTKQEYLEQLQIDLANADGNFIRTKSGQIMRAELKRLGYWKNKSRGNPRKGGRNSRAKQTNSNF